MFGVGSLEYTDLSRRSTSAGKEKKVTAGKLPERKRDAMICQRVSLTKASLSFKLRQSQGRFWECVDVDVVEVACWTPAQGVNRFALWCGL